MSTLPHLALAQLTAGTSAGGAARDPAASLARVGTCVSATGSGPVNYLVRLNSIARASEGDARRADPAATAGAEPLLAEAIDGVTVCEGDRVLLVCPLGHPAIILGVLQRERPRLAQVAQQGEQQEMQQRLCLAPGQILAVCNVAGEAQFEIAATDRRLELRPVSDDVHLAAPGKLSISARQLHLESRENDLQLTSQADVQVRGEKIRLN